MILESCRHQSSYQVLKRTAIWGSACIVIGPTIIIPLYYTVNFPHGYQDSPESILDNAVLIQHLPTWKLLGFFIPFSLIHIPASHAPSDEIKVHLSMLVLTWPLWLIGLAYLKRKPLTNTARTLTARQSLLQQLRSGYVFGFYAATVSHLGTVIWCLSLGDTPGRALFGMFIPPPSWSDTLVSNHQGIISCLVKCTYHLNWAGLCTWAWVAYSRACQQQGRTPVEAAGWVWKLSWMSVVCGPHAVAIQLLIWKHDLLAESRKK